MKLFDKPVMYDVIDVNVDQYRDAETVFDYAEHSRFVKRIIMRSYNDKRYQFAILVPADKKNLVNRQIGALLAANHIDWI